jgi:hypothetical protein
MRRVSQLRTANSFVFRQGGGLFPVVCSSGGRDGGMEGSTHLANHIAFICAHGSCVEITNWCVVSCGFGLRFALRLMLAVVLKFSSDESF